ncbi:MAG TPA: NADH-quinone oxidoreductase subunit J [Candidatus Aminicenantes bacterium]|nr:NADH-quinone oxidoreductase subunit J [Candidatus Aminicenantes bacterium]
MGLILFILFGSIAIIFSLGLIFFKNQIYNALCLIVTLSALGGIFALLNAPFIAVVQIIIYAGAIMVLFVFVIMTINLKKGLPPERKKWPARLAIIIGIILFLELLLAILRVGGLFPPSASPAGTPANLGELLFSTFIYPFEITSVLIVAALVGAIVLGKKRNQE